MSDKETKPDQCKCENCGKLFTPAQPESEAIAEREKLFPAETEFSLVCETCFQQIMKWASGQN